MAKLMLIGKAAWVELTSDPEDGQWIAKCVLHGDGDSWPSAGCGWSQEYDTLGDASEYAADHADRGER